MEFRDLKAQYQENKNEIDTAIQKVIMKADYIGGKEVEELEIALADYVGVRNCITCANGTDAMSLVMMAWGIKEGDAVFVPDFTFFSTGEIVAFCGATPIFVDVDIDTFNLDPIKLENAIIEILYKGNLKPKVIIPVDLFGLPANYPMIREIARKYDLLILEDSAQGFGGSIGNQKAGSFGDVATTSFFPAKPLGCYGDGGAIFTDNDDLAQLITSIKNHGKGVDKYDNVRIGLNSRLDTIQAAILKVKLQAFISHELEDVNKVYRLYKEQLSDYVITPYIPDGFYSSFAQYTIRLNSQIQRDNLQRALKKLSIPSMIYYVKPLHKQSAFKGKPYNDNDYIVTNGLVDTVLSLPMHPYLRRNDIDRICEVIKVNLTKA